MKQFTRSLSLLALLLTLASSLPASTRADRALAAPVSAASTAASDPVADSWWGGVGAIGCGFGIRFWPAFGWNLGYNALVTVACMMMILDAAT